MGFGKSYNNRVALIDCLIAWLLDWLDDWLNDWMIEWLDDWMIEWLNDWMIEWLNDWMPFLPLFNKRWHGVFYLVVFNQWLMMRFIFMKCFI